jgi:hypothetical protein
MKIFGDKLLFLLHRLLRRTTFKVPLSIELKRSFAEVVYVYIFST